MGDTVQKIVIDRLFNSFDELERAILSARRALEKFNGDNQDIINRLNTYQDMLDKQRQLALALCSHAGCGKWEEVDRHIKLINGLSLMIRDDAREIISRIHKTPLLEIGTEAIVC